MRNVVDEMELDECELKIFEYRIPWMRPGRTPDANYRNLAQGRSAMAHCVKRAATFAASHRRVTNLTSRSTASGSWSLMLNRRLINEFLPCTS